MRKAVEAAIRFENVSKRFILRRVRTRSFKESLVGLPRSNERRQREEFWALKDVSFVVKPGETLALIGANGAGKSTALKLISRILEPTSGRVEVSGRMGALLQLGAGFHGDLTGRENVYLNGSILGLSRAEVRRKIDAIIAFSELERFIDVPVKHYSSGMYVRLGFSVAVHTDPEILLVDEVLAVGDQNFQHKCLERIMEMRRKGVTLCFVSHSLAAVSRLCTRAVWLDEGKVQLMGNVEDVIGAYRRHAADDEEARLAAEVPHEETRPEDGPEGEETAGDSGEVAETEEAKRQWGRGDVTVVDVSFLDAGGREQHVFRVGEPWVVRLRYRAQHQVKQPVFGLAIYRSDGLHVCGPNTHFADLDIPCVEDTGEVFYRVDHLPLMEGSYYVSVAVVNRSDTVMYDYHDRLHTFKVRQVEEGERYGLVSLRGTWEWRCGEDAGTADG